MGSDTQTAADMTTVADLERELQAARASIGAALDLYRRGSFQLGVYGRLDVAERQICRALDKVQS